LEKILKNMRVLIVTQYFWPENFRINDLALEMSKRNHDVTVLTALPNYPDGEVFQAYRDCPENFKTYENVKISRVPFLPRKKGNFRLVLNYLSFMLSASLLGPWKLRRQKFDVILVYAPSPISVAIPGIILRALKHAPMTLWVLDLWPETLRAVGVVTSNWMLSVVGFFVSFIYKNADLVLAQSKSFIKSIRHYAGDKVPIHYFPNWAETLFDQIDIAPAMQITKAPDQFTLMFAGNIGVAQDFPTLLAAAERLKEITHIKWLILGDGRMSGWVSEQIILRGLQHQFILLGAFPLEHMPGFFKHADALLVSLKDDPIFSMTIPGKVQSYLASGIPIIAALNGEGADILNENGAGLVCPAGDDRLLADQILRLANMTKAQRQDMGKQGRSLYEREFQRRNLVDQFEKSMHALIDHSL
jgi:colanic acid biosynthesis glycosyl transferase WcaI